MQDLTVTLSEGSAAEMPDEAYDSDDFESYSDDFESDNDEEKVGERISVAKW